MPELHPSKEVTVAPSAMARPFTGAKAAEELRRDFVKSPKPAGCTMLWRIVKELKYAVEREHLATKYGYNIREDDLQYISRFNHQQTNS